MGFRVAGIWLNPRSKNYWFRMGVPERHRARIGKREFKWSLDTTDIEVARDRHASKLGEVRALIARLDAEALASMGDEADAILGRGIAALARGNLSKNDDGVTGLIEAEDNVARGMLQFLAYRTRLTWGPDHADLVELELFGEIPEEMDYITSGPLGFIDPKDQDAVVTRVKSMESDPRYLGFANRDIARALLVRQSWMAAEYEVLLVANAAGVQVKPRTPLFDALAERVLRYLAERRFQHWPAHIDDLFTPRAIAIAAAPVETTPPAPETDVHRLSDALALWRKRRGLEEDEADKAYDEWSLAVDRFVELHGDLPLDRIKRPMVTAFKDVLARLPSRPKKAVACLPLREQVEVAIREKLLTLAPPSVKKGVTAIRSLLAVAVDEEWIEKNVAAGVTVDDAGYVGDERDRLTDEDMRTLYGSPLMTDPNACDDTMFWIMFMAPLQGARPGEHCKVKPEDVCREEGIPIIRIRRDRRRRVTTANGTEQRGRRQKTEGSIRDVPLHWILEEAGFMDFAEIQQRRGAAWLFDDLIPGTYGDRYKSLSRRINLALDGLGISASDKAFYSTRHTMKRETRRRRIAEHNADQLAGHSDDRTGRKYGQGSSLEDLKEDIDKLEFTGVDWDAVVRCGQARIQRLRAHTPAP